MVLLWPATASPKALSLGGHSSRLTELVARLAGGISKQKIATTLGHHLEMVVFGRSPNSSIRIAVASSMSVK